MSTRLRIPFDLTLFSIIKTTFVFLSILCSRRKEKTLPDIERFLPQRFNDLPTYSMGLEIFAFA